MQQLPQDELRSAFSLGREDDGIDQQTALRLKKRMAEEFKQQLTLGAPTDEDEAGLRRLSAQIKAKKVVVKLYLRYPLHAKLYLLHRQDPNNPDRRLRRQQQPDPRRPVQAGRTERGRAGSRRLPEAAKVVR